MGKISLKRVILGGLIAGIVDCFFTFQLDGAFFHYFTWPALFQGKVHIGSDDFTGLLILGLVGGILSMWVYAAIRPRFGAGVKTATIAGVTTFVIGTLMRNIFVVTFFEKIDKHAWMYATIGAFFVVPISTIAGAYFYKDKE